MLIKGEIKMQNFKILFFYEFARQVIPLED